jgi:hypothetical protein
MDCSNCGADRLAFPVPDAVREHVPDDRASATICTHCLRVAPSDEPVTAYPEFSRASDAFPEDGETAAVLASLLALVDRLALNRQEVDAVAESAERRGVDVLLFLDRVAADGDVDPDLDVTRRRTQLEQLI